MVGVAGKSKGCATCRRRKVKCDEAKPVCDRCRKANISCDGYARYAVFIDCGPAGYRRRAAREEVILPTSTVRHVQSTALEATNLIDWFCDMFTNASPSQYDLQPRSHWLALVAVQPSHHPALKAVLLGISLVSWSKVQEDLNIRDRGRESYQNALVLTQKALCCVEEAAIDDLLATACAMTLFELMESTEKGRDSWLSHVMGMEKLLCHRGSRPFTQDSTRAILEQVRYVLMIKHLNESTACVFGSTDWLTLPWCGVAKSVEQQVFDQGLALTALMEDSDRELQDKLNPTTICSTLQRSMTIVEALTSLIAEIGIMTQYDAVIGIAGPGMADPAKIMLLITALGVQLAAAAIESKMLSFLFSASREDVLPDWIRVSVASDSTIPFYGPRIQLARRILKLIEARRTTPTGALGTLRMIWSLQTAMQQFNHTSAEYQKCDALMSEFNLIAAPFDVLRPRSNVVKSTFAIETV